MPTPAFLRQPGKEGASGGGERLRGKVMGPCRSSAAPGAGPPLEEDPQGHQSPGRAGGSLCPVRLARLSSPEGDPGARGAGPGAAGARRKL